MKRQLAFLISRAQVPMEWALTEEEQQDYDTIERFIGLLVHLEVFGAFQGIREGACRSGISEPKSLEAFTSPIWT